MAMRYSVFNPDGEEFETPSEARSAQLRQALMLDQMRGGGNVQRSGSNGGGPDGFFQEAPQGPTFQDQLEAKKTMMREGVAGEMALGGQRGQQQMDLAGLQDTGQTTRARMAGNTQLQLGEIGIKPQMESLGQADRAYLDTRGATIEGGKESEAKSRLGALQYGIKGDILNGMGGGQGIVDAIPEAQRGEFASRAAGSLFGFDPTEEARHNRTATRDQAIQLAREVAKVNPQFAAQAVAAADKGDFATLGKLAQNAAELMVDPAVTNRVAQMKRFIDSNNIMLTGDDMQQLDNMYQGVAGYMQQRGVPPTIMEQVLAPIREALMAHGQQYHRLIGNVPEQLQARFGG